MKVTDIHNFIKKYNHIFKISGYSTMKKEDKIKLIEDKIKTIGKLDQSIKKEWEGYKSTGKMSKAFSDASMTASNYETEKKKKVRKKKVVKPTFTTSNKKPEKIQMSKKPPVNTMKIDAKNKYKSAPKPTFTTSNKKPETIKMSKKPPVNTMKIDDNNKYKSKLTKSLEELQKKLDSEPKPKKEKEEYDGEHIYWQKKEKMTLTQFMAKINSLGLKWSPSQLSKVRNNYFMQPAYLQNPKWKKEEQIIALAKYLYDNQQNLQPKQSELDKMKEDGVDMTRKYYMDNWMRKNVSRTSPQIRYRHSKEGYYLHTFNTSDKPKMPYSEIKDRLMNNNSEGLDDYSIRQVFKDFNVEMYDLYNINMNKYNEGADSYVLDYNHSFENQSAFRERALYWKGINRIIKDVDNWMRVEVDYATSIRGKKIVLTPVYFRRSDIDEQGMAIGSWAKDIAVIKLVLDKNKNPEKTIQPVPDIKKQKQSVVNREVSIYDLGTYVKIDDKELLSEIRNYGYYVLEKNVKKLTEGELERYEKYKNLSDKAKELLATILDKLRDYEKRKDYNTFNSEAKIEISKLIDMIRKMMKQSGAKTNEEKSKPEVPYSSANAMYKAWFKSIRNGHELKPNQDISPYVTMNNFVDWASSQPWYPDLKKDQDAMKVGMANEVKKYHDKLNEKAKDKQDYIDGKKPAKAKAPAKAPAKKVEKKAVLVTKEEIKKWWILYMQHMRAEYKGNMTENITDEINDYMLGQDDEYSKNDKLTAKGRAVYDALMKLATAYQKKNRLQSQKLKDQMKNPKLQAEKEKKMQKKKGLKGTEIFQDTIDEKVFTKSEITGFKELGIIFKVELVDKLLKAITNNTARLYVKKYINELRNVYDAGAKWKSGYKTLYNKLIKTYNTKILKKD